MFSVDFGSVEPSMTTLLAEAMYFMDLAASGLPERFKRAFIAHSLPLLMGTRRRRDSPARCDMGECDEQLPDVPRRRPSSRNHANDLLPTAVPLPCHGRPGLSRLRSQRQTLELGR